MLKERLSKFCRSALLLIGVGAICFQPSVFGFEYLNARWRLEDLPVKCYLNIASLPEDLPEVEVESAIVQSIAAWNQAAGLTLFQYAGRVAQASPVADDGWNVISWITENWTATTGVNSSLQGLNCFWAASDPVGSPPRHAIGKINDFLRGFDIALNAERYQWAIGAQPNRYDVQSAATHELGHALALGHPSDDPGAPDAPTMVTRAFPNDIKLRSLEADDIAGVRSIYRKVSGMLAEDAHWENLVIVEGDVIAPPNVGLAISHSSPQTIVHFSADSRLIVEGELVINAYPDRIGFTGVDNAQWGGLEIRRQATFELSGCIFDGAETALAIQSSAEATVEKCEFHRNQTAIRIVDGQSIAVAGIFRENDVGLETHSSREVYVTESIFAQNGVGVRLVNTSAQIQFANLTENTIGIEAQGGQPIRLRENNIARNEIGLRLTTGTVDLGRTPEHPGRNNLYDNTRWNLALEENTDAPIFAQGNFWGELLPEAIDRTIRDDVHGTIIRQIGLGMKPAGVYVDRRDAAHWDGRDNAGQRVASGVYFYHFRAGDYHAVKKMLVLQ